jgi:hypothetical protein
MSENDKKPTKAELDDAGYKATAADGDGDGMVQDGTKFERPVGYNIAARDGDGDGKVQDGTVFEREAGTELTTEQLDEVVTKEKAKADKPAKSAKENPIPSADHVVSGNDKDDVFLAQCVYKNQYARKSLTIHHLQRRLMELGYGDAMGDKDGWYGDNTKLAVTNYQQANQIEATGMMDERTIAAVFIGDHNVRVVI